RSHLPPRYPWIWTLVCSTFSLSANTGFFFPPRVWNLCGERAGTLTFWTSGFTGAVAFEAVLIEQTRIQHLSTSAAVLASNPSRPFASRTGLFHLWFPSLSYDRLFRRWFKSASGIFSNTCSSLKRRSFFCGF